jgi:hypothetical protein
VAKIVWEEDEAVDLAGCANCGAQDFMPKWLYDRQVLEYQEVIDGLPPELRELFPEKEPLNITAEEAINELYDL